MSNDASASIVSKVWSYAHVLKNAGGVYGNYIEQDQIVGDIEANAIDHLEAELARQITRSNRLRQSTLAAAFAGTLL